MNTTRLRALADIVENDTVHDFDMQDFIYEREAEPEDFTDNELVVRAIEAKEPCGTACCIAGYAAIEAFKIQSPALAECTFHNGTINFVRLFMDYLEIQGSEEYEAVDNLCFVEQWPYDAQDVYYNPRDDRQQRRVAAKLMRRVAAKFEKEANVLG